MRFMVTQKVCFLLDHPVYVNRSSIDLHCLTSGLAVIVKCDYKGPSAHRRQLGMGVHLPKIYGGDGYYHPVRDNDNV